MGLTDDQIIEIDTDTFQRTMYQVDHRFIGSEGLLLDSVEQGFDRLDKLHHPVETDNGQRPLHLVQMVTAELDLGQITGTGQILLQGLIGPLQRQINLALDPGQWADIKFGRSIHDPTPISIKRSSASNSRTSSNLQWRPSQSVKAWQAHGGTSPSTGTAVKSSALRKPSIFVTSRAALLPCRAPISNSRELVFCGVASRP